MCGIYSFFSKNQVPVKNIIQNLNKIQHRGHDSYGILVKSDTNFLLKHEKGKIPNYYGAEMGNIFLGHLRYKTSGLSSENGAQPIISQNQFGSFYFVFNGNIPCDEYDTKYTLDSNMIKDFFERNSDNSNNWSELLIKFQNKFKRAFSIILVTDKNELFLIKDRYGVRPLAYSYSSEHQQFEAASESVGLGEVETTNVSEVKPGEILGFNLDNISSPKIIYNYNSKQPQAKTYGGKCIFEYIYFLNPETVWDHVLVNNIRKNWAETLALSDKEMIETRVNHIVIGIPSTGIEPGKAYAKTLELPYFQAITKNPDVNRTFILSGEERDRVSKKKYIFNKHQIEGNHVTIIDDSIVRGVTMRNLVKNIFSQGALSVHIRIISPTITNICRYGIDIPTKEELIATNKSVQEMANYFEATSLKFLSIDQMLETIHPYINKNKFCSGCFGGTYNDNDNDNNIDIEDLGDTYAKQKNTCYVS